MKKSILVILLMSTITAANAANCTNHKQGLRWCFEWSAYVLGKQTPGNSMINEVYRNSRYLQAGDYVDAVCNYQNYSNGVTKEFVTQMAAASAASAYITRDVDRVNRVSNACAALLNNHLNDNSIKTFFQNN